MRLNRRLIKLAKWADMPVEERQPPPEKIMTVRQTQHVEQRRIISQAQKPQRSNQTKSYYIPVSQRQPKPIALNPPNIPLQNNFHQNMRQTTDATAQRILQSKNDNPMTNLNNFGNMFQRDINYRPNPFPTQFPRMFAVDGKDAQLAELMSRQQQVSSK